jgi:hypothetical protein
MIRTLVLFLLGSAIAFAGVALPSSASPSQACRTSQLLITLARIGAVTGEEGGYLRFANRGSSLCRLSGWPTAVAIEADGTRIRARHAVHGTMLGAWRYRTPLPVMTLKPGKAAYAVIAAGDHPAKNPAKPCSRARWLRIAPPGDSHRVTLSAWLRTNRSYLPLCTAYDGSPELEVSAAVPLSALAH